MCFCILTVYNDVMNKLIRLTQAQFAWIQAEARRLGITQMEVIRRIIDRAMGEK